MSYELGDLVAMAQRHGEISKPEHEVGDLQVLVRVCWGLLTQEQKELVLASHEVKELVAASRGMRYRVLAMDVNGDEFGTWEYATREEAEAHTHHLEKRFAGVSVSIQESVQRENME